MGELMERVCQRENLVEAWRKVRSNIKVKRRAHSQGVDLVSILDFEADLEENLEDLALDLRQGTYLPMPVKWVEMGKKRGGKRNIGVLAVRDRIAQRAVLNVIEPLFDEKFLDCSSGFRPGRSVEDALEQVSIYRSQGYGWVVDADIEACFSSLDQRLLMHLVRQEIQDKEILHLIKLWLEVGRLSDRVEESGLSLERILEIASEYLEKAAQWGIDYLLADRGTGLSLTEEPPVDLAMDDRSARQEALHRLAADLTLLLLSFYRPILRRLRELPAVGRKLDRKSLLKGTAMGSALAGGILLAKRISDRGRGSSGILQGGAISPLLANIYLHQFDLKLTSKGYKLVRYADDFLVLCRSRAEAEGALEACREALTRIHLCLNESKTHIVSFEEGFTFLGAYFRREIMKSIPEGSWERRFRLVERRYWRKISGMAKGRLRKDKG